MYISLSEHIKLRPNMYGIFHYGQDLFLETLYYVIDEHVAGYGNRIEVKFNSESFSIRDFGRSIPFETLEKWNNDDKTELSRGEYNEFVNISSIGLTIDLTIVKALSKYFNVTSLNDGVLIECTFDIEYAKKRCFRGINLENFFVEQILERMACLHPNLEIVVNDKTIQHKDGLMDFLFQKTPWVEWLIPIINYRSSEFNFAIAYGLHEGSRNDIYSFVNRTYTARGGTHQEIFSQIMNECLLKITGVNNLHGISAAIHVKMKNPIYADTFPATLGDDEKSMMHLLAPIKYIIINHFFENPNHLRRVFLRNVDDDELKQEQIKIIQRLDAFETMSLLCQCPQVASLCDWDELKTKLSDGQWLMLLGDHPQFEEHFDWARVEQRFSHNWCDLLKKQPQFATHCDLTMLDGRQIRKVLKHQPVEKLISHLNTESQQKVKEHFEKSKKEKNENE